MFNCTFDQNSKLGVAGQLHKIVHHYCCDETQSVDCCSHPELTAYAQESLQVGSSKERGVCSGPGGKCRPSRSPEHRLVLVGSQFREDRLLCSGHKALCSQAEAVSGQKGLHDSLQKRWPILQ